MIPFSVKDVMERDPIVTHPDTPLIEAANLLAEKKFDGMPVVDSEGTLLGILTEYDLVSNGSAIHLPTFQKVLQNLSVFKKDQSEFSHDLEAITSLKVKDVMNTDPITLSDSASFEDVVAMFREHHRVNPIPVLNDQKKLVGVVSRFDVLKPLHVLYKENS
jgi:CBS domain-containing protein